MVSGTELKQRLAAILAADVAGYSRLMAADDRATVASLDAARAVFRARIESNQGRVIDMTGDSVLALFETAIGAVSAALAVQQELYASSSAVPEGRRMQFRIGVHLGDIIEKADGTVYGDGVNIAARLQALAEVGGVMVSDSVRNAVNGKVSASFEDLGERQLKNIAEPLRVYTMAVSETLNALEGFSVANPVRGFGGRPAIAVLPFENLSNDPEQVYFADGIAEDILTRLAMWRWMPVIGRNSSFVYRGKAVDLKRIGAELGARYILGGSVRKAGDRLRITGQLIDADTGHHVWTERYDRVLDDVFELQDEITDAIVTALEPAVGQAERARAQRKGTRNLDAWDLYHRGAWCFAQLTRESLIEAHRLYLAASEKDSQFATALASAAFVKQVEAMFTWSNPVEAIGASYRLALEAMKCDALDPSALSALGVASVYLGHHEAAIEYAEKSVSLNPSSSTGQYTLGFVRNLSSQPAEAIAALETAIRLSPNDFIAPNYFGTLSTVYYMKGDYERACEVARHAIRKAPQYPHGYRCLASALGQMGQLEEGRRALGEFVRLAPEYRTAMARQVVRFAKATDFEHYMDGMRKLGWTD